MQTTRRTFLRVLATAALGLTLALPSRTWGYEKFEEFEPHYYTGAPIWVGGAIDALARRSMEKRTALGA